MNHRLTLSVDPHTPWRYLVGLGDEEVVPLAFQTGPCEGEPNGLSNEVLLAAVMDRIERQDAHKACPENAGALHHLRLALARLHARANRHEAEAKGLLPRS
jgi:hypothetical protein